MPRPARDHVFMAVAKQYADLSACLRRKVGAITVRDGHQLTSGYNGPPKKAEHCEDLGGCRRRECGTGEGLWKCRAVHAEVNAVIQAARFGPSIDGATLYTTAFPCNLCALLLVNSGIVEVVAQSDYANEEAKEYLSQAGIKVRFI